MREDHLQIHFAKFEDEFCKFENIPVDQRLHENRFLCGLLKIHTLVLNNKVYDAIPYMKILYLASECDFSFPLTDDEVLYLTRCGIEYNRGANCLASSGIQGTHEHLKYQNQNKTEDIELPDL